MAIQTFRRVESKYRLSFLQFEALLPRLLQHTEPDAYCRDNREYTIYSVYYDTPDNRIIRQSIAKPYYKEKLRMRSYTAPTSPDDIVFLELKKKIGGIVSKRRINVPLKDARRFIEFGTPPSANSVLEQQVANEIAFFLERYPVRPAVCITYDRLALFGKDDHDFRITFDHNIRTQRSGLSIQNGGTGQPLIPADEWLMEIKISQAVPFWLAPILSDLGIFRTSFSKYGHEYQQYCLQNHPSFIPSGQPGYSPAGAENGLHSSVPYHIAI